MAFDAFLDEVAATFFGNLLFLGFVYFLYRLHKADKEAAGDGLDNLPLWVYPLGLTPLIYFVI